MGAVNKVQLSEGEGDVLLRVVRDTAPPALHLRNGLHQQVGVITPQVVNHHRNAGGMGFSLRLQALWAAPRYSPVMWQWSRTESPSRGLSHKRHASAVWKAIQSSRVILIALGSASTPLILLSSSCSDSKKNSAALGPRYLTGGSVWPSHRTMV